MLDLLLTKRGENLHNLLQSQNQVEEIHEILKFAQSKDHESQQQFFQKLVQLREKQKL